VEAATRDTCRADFAFAAECGAHIDLLVPGAGPAEWEAFWSALRAGPVGLRAFREDEPIPLPGSAAQVFAEDEGVSIGVWILAGNVTVTWHCICGDLKFGFDPRKAVGASAFEAVLAVMRLAAAAVRLPLLVTEEGARPESAFLRVWPDGRAEFLPAGSVRGKSLWSRIAGVFSSRRP
jgi:hypothetical protein